MSAERTIVIPKKALQWGLIIALILIALVLGAPLLTGVSDSPDTDPTTSAATTPSAGTPASTDTGQQGVDTALAVQAAGDAVREIMWLDHSEGREAWALRIDPICTPNGMAFWNGPFFADQLWPVVMERQVVTTDIEIIEALVVREGTVPGSVVIEVTSNTTYTALDATDPLQDENTNEIVMVYGDDGAWLTDGPPFAPPGS